MSRPLFVKVNDTQKQAQNYYLKLDNTWKTSKLIYQKVNDKWEHGHDYQDTNFLSAATCQEAAIYRDDCPCGALGLPYYSGSVNPDNHTGVEVYGGTALSHTQYNCCGLITSAIHVYGNPSYNWNGSSSCTASAECECQYRLSETVTPSFLNSAVANCLYPRREDYKATFSNNNIFHSQIKSFYYGNVDLSNHVGYAIIDSYTPDGYEHYTHTVNARYECCGETYTYPENCSNFYYGAVVTQPTCGQPGTSEKLCGVCHGLAEYDYTYPPATGNHVARSDWTSPVGSQYHWHNCKNCSEDTYFDYALHVIREDGWGGYYCEECGYTLNANGETL